MIQRLVNVVYGQDYFSHAKRGRGTVQLAAGEPIGVITMQKPGRVAGLCSFGIALGDYFTTVAFAHWVSNGL